MAQGVRPSVFPADTSLLKQGNRAGRGALGQLGSKKDLVAGGKLSPQPQTRALTLLLLPLLTTSPHTQFTACPWICPQIPPRLPEPQAPTPPEGHSVRREACPAPEPRTDFPTVRFLPFAAGLAGSWPRWPWLSAVSPPGAHRPVQVPRRRARRVL